MIKHIKRWSMLVWDMVKDPDLFDIIQLIKKSNEMSVRAMAILGLLLYTWWSIDVFLQEPCEESFFLYDCDT